MTIDDDLREELIEYLEKRIEGRHRYAIPIERQLLNDLQAGCDRPEFLATIYDYLEKDFDINWEGGPNEAMNLAGQMTFQDDYNYWYPLWKGEKQAGLLDPRDPDIIDEFGRKR